MSSLSLLVFDPSCLSLVQEEIERAADEIRKKREKESTELEQEKSKNMVICCLCWRCSIS